MAQIRSHATSVETLKNGALLLHLKDGREIEQVAGKSPYVVVAGSGSKAPAPAATTAVPAAAATTTPAATTPATTK
jgi:hypothetical protein